MKFLVLICYFHFCLSSFTQAQIHPEKTSFENPVSIADPAFLKKYEIKQIIIDSVLQMGAIPDIPGSEIAYISILKDLSQGETATLVIKTRTYIRTKYWRLFSVKSKAYREAVPSPATFSDFSYFVNGMLVNKHLEEGFPDITERSLRKIQVENKEVHLKVKK